MFRPVAPILLSIVIAGGAALAGPAPASASTCAGIEIYRSGTFEDGGGYSYTIRTGSIRTGRVSCGRAKKVVASFHRQTLGSAGIAPARGFTCQQYAYGKAVKCRRGSSTVRWRFRTVDEESY